jgi:4-hydroxy-tetrahydrodipicolinate synthase
MFEGSFVAIVTPMKDGKVDGNSLRDLIEFHVANGTDGIVPCGTTGESATLTHDEHREVISIAVEVCKGRIPVLAGTGSNSTREAITLTQHAEKAGADGALLITPYYNKPSQDGLHDHFISVAKETGLPIILYNVPGRTSVNMLPETVERLAKTKNIVGIKEASGSLQQIGKIISLCGDDFTVISGDDPLLWPILAIGGKGVISVTANVLPHKVAELCSKAAENKVNEAQALHYELMNINEIMFIDTNPVPAKVALSLMGKMSAEVRQPLSSLSKENTNKLKAVLKEYSLIDG